MVKKVNIILKGVIEKVKPEEQTIKSAEKVLKEFVDKFNINSKKLKVKAEAFVGGSFAKNTVIKKEKYDADVFIRYEKVDEKKISEITEKILRKFTKGFKIIHGSRDYFQIITGPGFFIEVIPVMKVNKPKDAKNITDLSYSHVNYIRKKAKGKMLDEIRLTKSFCYANKCYGAESYINGFSGYSIELLICKYGSFLNFIKAVSKTKPKEKIVIDIEKHYKNKNIIMMDINESKLHSPIILIDPTYRQRNALAALSEKTFEDFKIICKNFLKKPSKEYFELKETNLEEIKKRAKKNRQEFILLEATTEKQEGDVAGSKLFKFYNHLTEEIERFFDIKDKGFNYNGQKSARCYFVIKRKEEIILNGPLTIQKKDILKFKKKHRNTFVKGKKIYARERINISINQFVSKWEEKNKRKIREMSVKSLKIIN